MYFPVTCRACHKSNGFRTPAWGGMAKSEKDGITNGIIKLCYDGKRFIFLTVGWMENGRYDGKKNDCCDMDRGIPWYLTASRFCYGNARECLANSFGGEVFRAHVIVITVRKRGKLDQK